MPRAKTPRNGDSRNKKAVISETESTNGRGIALPADLQDQIRIRAYELYERRGCEPGHEVEDWALAEKEVLARHSLQTV
jgi:Protein of unknown function (DUF2934)